MIAYYLFDTYDICGSVKLSKLGWGGGGLLLLCSYFDFTDCSFCYWVTAYRCMLVITLLLHMLYVI